MRILSSKNSEQLEAIQTIINGLTAFKNRPACISGAKYRYGILLEGIEKYRRTKRAPGYLEVDDDFLFTDSPTSQKGFEEMVIALKKQIEDLNSDS